MLLKRFLFNQSSPRITKRMMPLLTMALLICAALSGAALSPAAEAECNAEIVFPDDARIIDVTKPPYNAKGDGVHDDTAAINAALKDFNSSKADYSPDRFMSYTIYLPEGTYLVSDTLEARVARDKTGSGVRLVGQGRDRTIIRLADDTPGFDNPQRDKNIVRMAPDGAQPNSAYGNYVQHLTVDAGAGNPGASGIRFDVANSGAMENVRIRGEKSGCYGLVFRGTCGLGYVRDVTIEGFQVGVYLDSATVNNIAFERLTLLNQGACGILNEAKNIQLLDLTSHNRGPAIRAVDPMAVCFLLNAKLEGTGPGPAIHLVSPSFLYLRDVEVKGYTAPVQVSGDYTAPLPAGPSIDEWWSFEAPFMAGKKMRSLRLPIKNTPTFYSSNLEDWASVMDFGATPDDDSDDDAPGIQKAIDSGKPVVYFPRGFYTLKTDVVVRGGVRKVDFLFSRIQNGDDTEARIVVEDTNHPEVVLENFVQMIPMVHNSASAVAFRNRGPDHALISVGDKATGDLFVENAGPHTTIEVRNGVHAWLRAINREKSGLLNDGSTVWSFADNIETMRRRGSGDTKISPIRTVNGGRTEIIGACMDALQVAHVPADGSLMSSEDSEISVTCGGEIRRKGEEIGSWPVHVTEIRNGEKTRITEEQALYFTSEGQEFPKRFVIPMYRSPRE